jgi:hypothetical protein
MISVVGGSGVADRFRYGAAPSLPPLRSATSATAATAQVRGMIEVAGRGAGSGQLPLPGGYGRDLVVGRLDNVVGLQDV